jgi:hypothetical protein
MPKVKNHKKTTPGDAIPPLSLVPSASDSAPSSSAAADANDQLQLNDIDMLCDEVLLDSRLLFPGSKCREVSLAGVDKMEYSITLYQWNFNSKAIVYEDRNSVSLVPELTSNYHDNDNEFEELLKKAKVHLRYQNPVKWAIVAENSRIWKSKTFKVVDGMHRIAAVKDLYDKGIWLAPFIPVVIVKPFTAAQEARLCQLAFNLNAAQHQIVATSFYDQLCFHKRQSELAALEKPGKSGKPSKVGWSDVKGKVLPPGQEDNNTLGATFYGLTYVRDDEVLMKYMKED